jgi:hypothetical protein
MKPKIGRPTVPKIKAKTVLRGAMYAPSELKRIEPERIKSGLDNSKFIRNAVENEVKRPPLWFKSGWNKDELEDQLIEFDLKSPSRRISGIGKLSVRSNPSGEIAVDIFVDEMQPDGSMTCTRIWLAKDAVEKIELNPKLKPAKFKLVG